MACEIAGMLGGEPIFRITSDGSALVPSSRNEREMVAAALSHAPELVNGAAAPGDSIDGHVGHKFSKILATIPAAVALSDENNGTPKLPLEGRDGFVPLLREGDD